MPLACLRRTSLLTLPSKRKIDFPMELTVGITGASGAIYAHRTLVHLAASGAVNRINLILSDSAKTVAMVELGLDLRSADEKKINEWIGLPSSADDSNTCTVPVPTCPMLRQLRSPK